MVVGRSRVGGIVAVFLLCDYTCVFACRNKQVEDPSTRGVRISACFYSSCAQARQMPAFAQVCKL